jgi:hypothetical protein
VPTDTKLAQQFAFCPLIRTMHPAAISPRATSAAANRVGGFSEVDPLRMPASNRARPRGSLGARDSHLQVHRYARTDQSPARPKP